MSGPPSKQAVVEFRTSKSRPSMQTLQRPSLRAAPSESKRRLLSKISVFGFLGSRMFFHKRGDRLKVPKYQNTYRLEPFRAYHADDVDKIVQNIMERKLSIVTSYDPQQAAQLTSEIGTDVQKAIIRKDYDRYKIVTQVGIGQRLDQGIHASFQCLWDVERDNYSYYVFENNHIYAWCCVFGIYYE
ncbi:dynein light chain Tctex-type protein 2B [Megachile rotundata]|uniref:dynein light chain Tctex-type protein 2B n=1 Tax=Megachile rotundata TaxID=143995 RepID=UPI0006152FAD|nr:PREDICTED: tctex1 domain-containing protein 2-like [Megachile rotundata]